MTYNWQQPDWPLFSYRLHNMEAAILSFTEETGHITGMMKGISEDGQVEAALDMMVAEAIKTSEIEGEYLSRPDVLSSIRNYLGLNKTAEKIKDKKAKGAGELMVAVRRTFAQPLTEETLFSWHQMLLGANDTTKTGAWRTHAEPMQVISGAMGKEKIHFEAPSPDRIPAEMHRFILWFNDTAPGAKKEIRNAPVRAAVAHLYFESIHPFEDGNGRIGRAIAEKALSQTIGRPALLSLSQTIEADKKAYYSNLEKAQRSNDITPWVRYFVQVIVDAQAQAKALIDFTLKKTKFFATFSHRLNERQLKAVRKMMDAGPAGFQGGMTAGKYIAITKASKATATRDLQALTDLGIFIIAGAGRNTHYSVNL